MVSSIESFNIAFVVDDIAHTFELDSITKGIVGGSGFLGESITRCTCGFCKFTLLPSRKSRHMVQCNTKTTNAMTALVGSALDMKSYFLVYSTSPSSVCVGMFLVFRIRNFVAIPGGLKCR